MTQSTLAHKTRPSGVLDMDTAPEDFAGTVRTCPLRCPGTAIALTGLLYGWWIYGRGNGVVHAE